MTRTRPASLSAVCSLLSSGWCSLPTSRPTGRLWDRALIVEAGAADLQERLLTQPGQVLLVWPGGPLPVGLPEESLPAPSSASAPASPGPSQGTSSAHHQAGRPPVQRQTEGSRQAPSGRMYAAQTEEATAAENVVAGIILLHGIQVRALFDTGASHSFIDRLFAELHDIPLVSLLHPGRLVVPDHTLDIREFCPSCPVRIGD
uniref:Peptidase A2 domain-containing protein n=1 Tax=Ananas comosus var. bracteatus TaxID=296719 RepID=A0A6V7PFG3_ANACO|nr:unnamed protein product [Ananas comosus var. bracteatus]